MRIKDAYDSGDRDTLAAILEELPILSLRVRALWEYHRNLWYSLNKPVGWEVLDARYGTLMTRVDTARLRLESYLSGGIERIEELEEPRLPYEKELDYLPMVNNYQLIASASRN